MIIFGSDLVVVADAIFEGAGGGRGQRGREFVVVTYGLSAPTVAPR